MNLKPGLVFGVALLLGLTVVTRGQEDGVPARPEAPSSEPLQLTPTRHTELPQARSDYWYVADPSSTRSRPAGPETVRDRFARGVRLISDGNYSAGLPLVTDRELAKTELADYAQYYAGLAYTGQANYAQAEQAFSSILEGKPAGYLEEVVPARLADVALARNDARRAVDVLRSLNGKRLYSPEAASMQLARAAERAGDVAEALKAYRRVYYDFPLSSQASDAQVAIARLQTPDNTRGDRALLDRKRAEALYAAKRWAAARTAFEPLARSATGSDKIALAVRLAACDYYLDRFRVSRDALVPYLGESAVEAEARFFHLSATRGLGDATAYVNLARKLIEEHPQSPWTEEALNNLASYYITTDDDDAADAVFRQILQRFPKGRYGDRAAWRVGWRSYRTGNMREAADLFERAALEYPRADYRPSWLYWAGRARQALNETPIAARRYAVAVSDYQNSYYGRLAARQLEKLPDAVLPERVDTPVVREPAPAPVPTDAVIRTLVGLELYDDALREIQFAQRVWGESSQLQATSAFIRHNQGLLLKAEDRFAAIRGAITTMRRAYPQFMAAGGEKMPDEVLRIIFPLDYWPLITKYSKLHNLDPFLVTALMAQESTFTAEIRSSANAYGLMQIIPATGRRYARQLGIKNFTTSTLKNPEINVRLGTEYFSDLMARFGGAQYALAGYNAGEGRVQRWLDERPPMTAEEFVEEIPFSETQNYVKRIIGTAEDYRRLYGVGRLDPNVPLAVPAPVTPAAAAARKPAASPAKKAATPAARKPATAAAKKPATPARKTPARQAPASRSRR